MYTLWKADVAGVRQAHRLCHEAHTGTGAVRVQAAIPG